MPQTQIITKDYLGLKITITINIYPDFRAISFVCYSNSFKIGNCFLKYFNQTKKVSIGNFLIGYIRRRKGYGRKLWGFVEEYIKQEYAPSEFSGEISDVDDFDIASSFWHEMGFTIVGKKIHKNVI